MSQGDGKLRLVHDYGSHLDVSVGELVIARYVYSPLAAQRESPKPYFVPVRTLAGDVVTVFRPNDHVWHKGIYLGFPYVGEENLYGGPTYVDGEGYLFLDNNGSMVHEGFDLLELSGSSVQFSERLGWFDHDGQRLADEHRVVSLNVPDAPDGAWFLRFSANIHNHREEPLVFSSPTVRGRPQAGYGGLMWRGPRSFTGGEIIGPDGRSGPDMMGQRAEWLAFVGRHDEVDRQSTIVFVEAGRGPGEPIQWFVRSEPYAMIGSAPFFDADVVVEKGGSFRLASSVIIADGAWDAGDIQKYVDVHDLASADGAPGGHGPGAS
jgi:hypothetical protein